MLYCEICGLTTLLHDMVW